MAASDYFNQKPLPGAPSSSSTPAPPYSSQPHLAPGVDRPSHAGLSASPFETVFDDHVYPASAHQQSTPSTSQHRLSHQDTGYHGHSPVSPVDMAYNHSADDIPLQDSSAPRLPPKDAEMQDHVYDASRQRKKKPRRGRVRFGELGMLGSGRKAIPFVVYFFTIVQVAVFIGEIVKNGEFRYCPVSLHYLVDWGAHRGC